MKKNGESCLSCKAPHGFVQMGLPGSGILYRCSACGYELRAPDPDPSDDDEPVDLGLTVGELRRALEGVPDDFPVTLRVTHEESGDLIVTGIRAAVTEDSCLGPHFAIDGIDEDV